MDRNLEGIRAAPMISEDAVLSFGPFELDLQRGTLLRDGKELALRPKCFEVLTYLVRNPGRLVTKEELLAAAWPGLVVTDSSVPQCLVEIRRVLGAEAREYIHTVPRRGYRLEAAVRRQRSAPLQARPVAVWKPVSRSRLSHTLILALLATGLGVPAFDRLAGGDRSSPGAAAQPPLFPPVTRSLASSAGRESFLQGKYLESRRAPGDMARAVGYFQRATDLDPGLVDAWVELAHSTRMAAREQSDTSPKAWEPAYTSALEHALALDPKHPEANIRAASYYQETGDHSRARRHFETAMRYGSESALVQATAAGVAFWERDLQRAVDLATRAVELEPLSFVHQENLGVYQFFAGNPAQARRHLQIARDINPAIAGGEGDFLLLQALVLLQDFEAATALAGRMPEGAVRDQGLALVGIALGQPGQGDPHVARLAESPTAASALRLAEVYGYLGQHDLSLRWLTSAIERKQLELANSGQCCDVDFALSAVYSPFLAKLHRDSDSHHPGRLLAALDAVFESCESS